MRFTWSRCDHVMVVTEALASNIKLLTRTAYNVLDRSDI
jgi:hypothetical protein